MLQLKSINVILSKDTALETQVLHNFDLEIGKSEFVMIVGSNGCGKSTYLILSLALLNQTVGRF